MGWKDDIREWANKTGRDVSRQEDILIADGWEPKKYQPSMKKALFDYLNKWHTLHIKNMPTPATSHRRNPYQHEGHKDFKKNCFSVRRNPSAVISEVMALTESIRDAYYRALALEQDMDLPQAIINSATAARFKLADALDAAERGEDLGKYYGI